MLTALHQAILSSNLDCVKTFLELGADHAIKAVIGNAQWGDALDLAILRGETEIARAIQRYRDETREKTDPKETLQIYNDLPDLSIVEESAHNDLAGLSVAEEEIEQQQHQPCERLSLDTSSHVEDDLDTSSQVEDDLDTSSHIEDDLDTSSHVGDDLDREQQAAFSSSEDDYDDGDVDDCTVNTFVEDSNPSPEDSFTSCKSKL